MLPAGMSLLVRRTTMMRTTNYSTADPTAWVDSYGDYLFRYARARVHSDSAAEDLVQETLLAALQSMRGFSGESTTRTWLTGILKHKIIDHYRRSVTWVLNDGNTTEDEFFDSEGRWQQNSAPSEWYRTPEDMLEDRELSEVLNNCVSRLPSHLAAVFSLREIEGLSSPEICDLLALTPSNYWVMFHRARLLMRREFNSTLFPAHGSLRQFIDVPAV